MSSGQLLMPCNYHAGLNPVGHYQDWNRVGSSGNSGHPVIFCLDQAGLICLIKYLGRTRILHWIIYIDHSKKAMEYERFGNCLTNARQKTQYVFGQNFTDLAYVDRRHSLLTAFVPGSIQRSASTMDKIILWSFHTHTAKNHEFLDTPVHIHVHVVTMHEYKTIMMVLIANVQQIKVLTM